MLDRTMSTQSKPEGKGSDEAQERANIRVRTMRAYTFLKSATKGDVEETSAKRIEVHLVPIRPEVSICNYVGTRRLSGPTRSTTGNFVSKSHSPKVLEKATSLPTFQLALALLIALKVLIAVSILEIIPPRAL